MTRVFNCFFIWASIMVVIIIISRQTVDCDRSRLARAHRMIISG